MARRLPSMNALKAFEAAARHESFTQAAEELCVTQGAVSHQVKALEEELGLKLFHRAPQSLTLTETGREYMIVVRDALDRIAIGTDQILQRQNSGVLTVSTSPNFAAKWLVHRLGKFAEAYPDIDLRVSATLHHVDFANEDVDIAVRHSDGKLPGLHVVQLYEEHLFPVCSPKLLKAPHGLKKPMDLIHHPLLHLENRQDWTKWLDAAGVKGVDLSRGPVLNQASMIIDAAVDGQGVALSRSALVAHDLIAGRLVRPFSIALPVNYGYWIVSPKATAEQPKVKIFRDWLLAEVADDMQRLQEL